MGIPHCLPSICNIGLSSCQHTSMIHVLCTRTPCRMTMQMVYPDCPCLHHWMPQVSTSVMQLFSIYIISIAYPSPRHRSEKLLGMMMSLQSLHIRTKCWPDEVSEDHKPFHLCRFELTVEGQCLMLGVPCHHPKITSRRYPQGMVHAAHTLVYSR